MARRAPESILELAVAIGGYRKGLRVCVFIEQWTLAQRALGHEPTVIEAADWWKESQATWFRRLDEFREIFDLMEYPTPVASQIIERSEARGQNIGSVVALLGRMPIPRSAQAHLAAP